MASINLTPKEVPYNPTIPFVDFEEKLVPRRRSKDGFKEKKTKDDKKNKDRLKR